MGGRWRILLRRWSVRSFPAETARKIISALKDVVSKQGTAQKAEVPGFRVAGKTGTAQKVDPRGGYMSGRYVTSFVGFMPADDPKFTLLVLLDDPTMKEGAAFGGVVAGPIFSRIAEKAARYLDLRPTEEIPSPAGCERIEKSGFICKESRLVQASCNWQI